MQLESFQATTRAISASIWMAVRIAEAYMLIFVVSRQMI